MRSSDTIAELAGALAKAQVELQNPPKSLTAYLEPRPDGSPGQAYRYAPLSSGLEIVRKALGQHGIAVVQTTELDQGTGTLMLTTTLAHSSGEWMASSWPVCERAEMGHPKLMGAALTYARRYSLFALVGLAGEDDLDAPELAAGVNDNRAREATYAAKEPPAPGRRPNGAGSREAPVAKAVGADRVPAVSDRTPMPSPAVVDLVQALDEVETADALLAWTVAALPSRNRMDDADRRSLEAAFVTRARTVGADPELLLPFAPMRSRRGRTAKRQNPQQEASDAPQAAL